LIESVATPDMSFEAIMGESPNNVHATAVSRLAWCMNNYNFNIKPMNIADYKVDLTEDLYIAKDVVYY
jgi:hypothetical protein